MSKNSVDQKPSETALFAALHRALAHKTFQNERFGPDDLAEYFLPAYFRFFIKFKKVRANTRAKFDESLPGLHAYMIARTAWLDQLFIAALVQETPQIVLLGAGYDTRAYRFARHNRATKIFELDINPTQVRKQKCLQKTHIAIPPQVSLLPIDFNRESLKEVLVRGGYADSQKTMFIWEGVSYYLQPEAVDATLKFVSQTAHPDSQIAFDYTVLLADAARRQAYGVEKFTQTMQAQHAGEGLLFSLAADEIEPFLSQNGLSLISHLDPPTIEHTYLQQADGVPLGPITAHFRFVVAA